MASVESTSPKLTMKDSHSETNHDYMQIASFETLKIFSLVNYGVLSSIVCLFGIASNIINIIIFCKQGLNTTFNISFFNLAISDLLSVTTLQFTNICMLLLCINTDIPWDPREIQYLAGAWPHAFFGHITCWITAYMTVERCLCIAIPMKVKQVMTPKRTTAYIIFVYVINIVSVIPEYSSVYYDWKFYPDRNVSLLALAFRENRDQMEGIGLVLLSLLGAVSFPAVIVFTAALVFSLRRQAKWRKETTSDSQSETTLKRDNRTMKMVLLIATILIICNLPGAAGIMVTYILPGFFMGGSQSNLFFIFWSFAFTFEAINSSVNIFMYYRMSTKYRNTFMELVRKCGF